MDSTSPAKLPVKDELERVVGLARRGLEALDRVLLGRRDFHRLVMVGILSRGHILLEGVPGVGKTALIKALGEILDLEWNRVQFTPDLMPGDILGSHILQEKADGGREMTFQPGPVFTQILLADEINRASPKTQSALLEAMQERSVTLLGTTRSLPDPFFVLASQNPIELEGTYPLPEAQLDRFLFKLQVEKPGADVLEDIINNRRRGEPPKPEKTLSLQDLSELFAMMEQIYLPRPVARFIARLVAATHPGDREAPPAITSYVSHGASPRGAIGLAEAARAHALLDGRPTVGFEDVEAVAAGVLHHRLILSYKARFDGVTAANMVAELLENLDIEGLDLPESVEITGS